MKKIFNLMLVAFGLIIVNSCGDDFLDVEPQSENTAFGFLESEEDLELAVIGLYDVLQSSGTYGQNFSYFTEAYSDHAFHRDGGRAGSRYQQFSNFEVNANNLVLNPTWDACYNGIQRANIILNRAAGIDMDASLKARRVGEAKFIRALIYFNMVRIWGGVPLIVDEIEDPSSTKGRGRDSAEAVYAQIIQDLIDADNAGLPNVDAGGRVTDVAVRALLGKVYLTRGDWAAAESILRSIVTGGTHQLLPGFAEVFDISNENNAESIFEVQFIAEAGEASSYHETFGPNIGDNAATTYLLDQFNSDPRLADSFTEDNGTGFFFSNKFDDQGANGSLSGRNFIVLRYADVLLMLAETLNEQGYVTNGEAFDFLNAIRVRAGLQPLDGQDLPDQASFRIEIQSQRQLEFAHEFHRWFDLVRWGIAHEVVLAAKGISLENHRLLFPIPEEAIIENPALDQNQGYF